VGFGRGRGGAIRPAATRVGGGDGGAGRGRGGDGDVAAAIIPPVSGGTIVRAAESINIGRLRAFTTSPGITPVIRGSIP
jgi:hypothetical protein